MLMEDDYGEAHVHQVVDWLRWETWIYDRNMFLHHYLLNFPGRIAKYHHISVDLSSYPSVDYYTTHCTTLQYISTFLRKCSSRRDY